MAFPSSSQDTIHIPFAKLDTDTLFDEKFCKVKQGKLVLKCFYFPTGQNRQINTDNIKGVFYVVQDLRKQCGLVKGWGMSFSPCWWACDIRRCLHKTPPVYYNVVVDVGETTYKGFTVIDIRSFLYALRPQLGPDCIVRDELPF